MRLAGIDGCKGGWCVVHADYGEPALAEVAVVTNLQQVAELGIERALIDIPIGLTGDGVQRTVDAAARAALPGKTSSVFTAPVRATLASRSYAEACDINRREARQAISLQAYAILPKIAEVDNLMRSPAPPSLIEGHPEVSFAHASGAPILAPKRGFTGRLLRRECLKQLGFPDPHPLVGAARAAASAVGCRLGEDDVLDAAILLWSARRFVMSECITYPNPPGRDACGLTMAIHA